MPKMVQLDGNTNFHSHEHVSFDIKQSNQGHAVLDTIPFTKMSTTKDGFLKEDRMALQC